MPPWRTKARTQKLLSRLPFGETLNHGLQSIRDILWREGHKRHVARRIPQLGADLRGLARHVSLEGASIVEVGTGWTPLPTALLYLCGSESIRTYDLARHARFRLARGMLEVLRAEVEPCARSLGLSPEVISDRLRNIENATSLEDMFARAHTVYCAPGDATATGLPDESVDLYFSYSVLEYVPVEVLHAVLEEARRILRPTGRFYAFVGCLDDYASYDKSIHRLNYLKFSDDEWREIAMNSIQYVNRLREEEYIEIIRQHGATIEEMQHTLKPGDIENVRKMKVADRFARFTPEQNAVVRTSMVLSFGSSSGTALE